MTTQGSETTPIRRLGRGLNALLGGSEESSGVTLPIKNAEVAPNQNEIHVELIERNPYQPRLEFAEDSLEELASSLKIHGLLQPLLVRPHNGQYQLIAGERRLIAAKRAGIETVPCRVMELEDKQVCEVAIEENMKRKDLSVLEKAQAFKNYIDQFGSSIEELAKQLSMNRSTVSNILRLLDLSDVTKKALSEEKISKGHARAILSLEEADQNQICQRIQKESLTVRQVEEEVRSLLRDEPATIPFQATDESTTETGSVSTQNRENEEEQDVVEDSGMTNHLKSLCEQLQNKLGTTVHIKLNSKESGKIVIDFKSNPEFERIVGQLRRAA
ncbi:Chromosome (plasmid) partitioning protein ParB [hydrothermal vent metagenome]|uniref:Chromosome (Plasmid) partitioning protein ParB n=1 Tax=hydrothermal vent metagenome TaxID=652676 RepID=A0A3B1DGJ3_9ZZZZ